MLQGVTGLSQYLKHRAQVLQLQAAGTNASRRAPQKRQGSSHTIWQELREKDKELHANQLQVHYDENKSDFFYFQVV